MKVAENSIQGRQEEMIGYREKDGFHIILEGNESMDLIILISEGLKEIRKWELQEPLKSECVNTAQTLYDKFSVMFVGDNYNPSSEKRRIVARFIKSLKK